MALEISNHFKAQLMQGNIDVSTHVIKGILMASGFTFDKDTHATLADVSASELSHANGYNGAVALSSLDVTGIEDDINDRSRVSWGDLNLGTASGGSIGPSAGLILYDDTATDDTVIGCLTFAAEKTVTVGNDFIVSTIYLNLGSATYWTNHGLKMLFTGQVDITSDSLKWVFMGTGYAFDKDAHATYSDVSASELANGNGYTTGGLAASGMDNSNIEDDTNDRSDVSFNDILLLASGGSVGPTRYCLVVDDTTSDDTVLCLIGDAGSEETIPNGESMRFTAPLIRIS